MFGPTTHLHGVIAPNSLNQNAYYYALFCFLCVFLTLYLCNKHVVTFISRSAEFHVLQVHLGLDRAKKNFLMHSCCF